MKSRKQRLEYFAKHMSPWAVSPTSIGLTAGKVTQLTELVGEGETALSTAEELRQSSKAATLGWYNASNQLNELGQECLDLIRVFAESSADPLAVFQAAEVDPPAPPQPLGAPGKPDTVVASINEQGYLTLSWKSTNAAPSTGAFFTITRRLGSGAPALVGAVPAREFVDTTIPEGTGTVTYLIQGRRGQFFSEGTQYMVRFGVDGGGGFAIATQGESGKMAA